MAITSSETVWICLKITFGANFLSVNSLNFKLLMSCFFFFFFLIVSVNLGIISTVANEFRASSMSRTIETSTCKWTTCRSTIPIGMFGRCSWMLWTFTASSSFTFIVRRDGRLQHTTMCGPSKIRDESCRTKRMRMWCQFGTATIHTGNDERSYSLWLSVAYFENLLLDLLLLFAVFRAP